MPTELSRPTLHALQDNHMIKSKKTRWAEHVARMMEKTYVQDVGGEDNKGRENLEDIGVDGRTIFKWIVMKSIGRS